MLKTYTFRSVLCVTLLACSTSYLSAQAPGHIAVSTTPDTVREATQICYGNFALDTSRSRKIQSIYVPENFPDATSGIIKAIYVRNGIARNTGTLYNLSVRMGFSNKSSFNKINPYSADSLATDTFVTTLSPVFSTPMLGQNLRDSGGAWIRLPLDGPGFLYDATQRRNLVVELSFGPPWPTGLICFADTVRGGIRTLFGFDNTASASTDYNMDFGFDLEPVVAGVQAASTIGGLEVYPNPSEGYFRVSFDAGRPVAAVKLQLSTITGQVVQDISFAQSGDRFSKELNVSHLPKGMYFLRLEADGAVATRRVVIR